MEGEAQMRTSYSWIRRATARTDMIDRIGNCIIFNSKICVPKIALEHSLHVNCNRSNEFITYAVWRDNVNLTLIILSSLVIFRCSLVITRLYDISYPTNQPQPKANPPVNDVRMSVRSRNPCALRVKATPAS